MKKYSIYIAILAAGLLLGWLFFGRSNPNDTSSKQNTVTETTQMWTCAMHPQIMQPEAGDCPICGMDLIPAETSAQGLLANQFKLSENAMALANIQTSSVGNHQTEVNAIKLSGKIVENEDNSAIQPAHFNGRIEKLYVNSIGEKVVKGQAVAKIYAADLVAAQQELLTTYRLRASQPQLYQAVRNKFKNWKIQGAQLDAVLKTGEVTTSFTIYSHVSGVVTEISVSDGAHIMDGKPIFKVSNLASVWANFDVYEHQLSLFKKGQTIMVTTNAYPNKVYKATVDFIDPILNAQTRTVTLRAVLKNADGVFKPGMFVEGAIEGVSDPKGESITIPASAILWTGERSVVYVKTNPSSPVFEMREITLGQKIADQYQVLEGLQNGNEIVTNGTFTVDAAAQLQGKKSMMNRATGQTSSGQQSHSVRGDAASPASSKLIMNKRLNVPKEFQDQLNSVFNAYINIKDAFVEEDSVNVVKASKILLKDLTKVDMKLLKDQSAHTQWMQLEKQIKISANALATMQEVAAKKDQFKQLSLQLINAVQVFGVNKKVYVDFCPMADDNLGAYWLSQDKKISNPYFGGAMLSCGEVKQVIE